MSETWLMPDYPSNFVSIPNYNIIRTDREGRGGGVAFYLKAPYKFKKYYSSSSENVLEQLWLMVQFKNRKVALGVIYRPPNAHVEMCLNELSTIIEQIYLEANSVILLGDININLLDLNSTDSNKFNILLTNFDLCQVIKDPTRITNTTESLIDIICTSRDMTTKNCGTMDLLNITDHMMVHCNINIESEIVCPNIIYYRYFKDLDLNSFAIHAVHNTSWENIYNLHDHNSKVEFLNKCITSLFDVHAPICIHSKKDKYRPYITYNIKQMIKIKNKAHVKYMKTKTAAAREYYVTLKNYVSTAIKQEKVAYMQFVINKNKGNTKMIWKSLSNWGVNTQSSTKNNLPIDLCKPEEINNYFLNVSGHSTINNDLINFYSSNRLNENFTFNFREITNEDIYRALKTIKSQALGIDNINIQMLSVVMPYCIEVINHIFNYSIRQGAFPDLWKAANVLPIPKIPAPSNYNDLRPICILPALSKLFEKTISFQIIEYLDRNSILPENQSGFRTKHGTHTALLKVINDVTTALDKSSCNILVLLDQSKAFDLVNFDLLIAKLKYIGFADVALRWFYSYISSRTQRVVINRDLTSSTRETSSGVPQGSILGPILFSIYIFDFPKALSHCQVHLYADDIEMYLSFSFKDLETSIDIVNKDLENTVNYSHNHGLRINPNKTVAMCIGSENQKSAIEKYFKLNIDNSDIDWVTSAKNLGVIIDNNLSFNGHVEHVFKTSFFKLKALYRFKYQLSRELKLKLVKTLIYPHLDYCCSVYYNFLPQYNKNKLQRIQNACMRFVCCIPFMEHVTPYLIQLNELNVQQRMQYLITIFLYKLLKCRTPSYLYDLIQRRSDIHNANLRFNTFTIPQHNTNRFEGCFSYLAPMHLNKVINYLNLPLSQFKRRIKFSLKS